MKASILNPKGLLIMAAAFAIGVTSCKKEPEVPSVPTLEILQGGQVKSDIKLEPKIEGEDFVLVVKASRDWSVTNAASWITVSPTSGQADRETTVTISVAENDGAITRNASLVFALAGNAVKQTVTVSQLSPDSPGVDAIYFEDLGDFRTGTEIKKDGTGAASGWPKFTEFTTWRRGGTVDQSGVTYTGTGGVRNSGELYDPVEGSSISTAPSVVIRKTNSEVFMAGNINTGGKTNFTFKFALQNTESTGATTPFPPTFGPIDAATVKLQAGFDGAVWADLTYTVGTLDGNGWYWATSEFKIPSGTEKLYFKFSEFSAGTTLRIDDLTLTEGGNGELVDPGTAPESKMGKGLIAISDLITEWQDGTEIPANTKIIGTVVSIGGTAVGNISAPNASINVVDGTGEHSGLFIYGIRQTADNTKFLASHSYSAGTNLEIELGGSKMGSYKGLVQITDLPEANVKAAPAGTTTYADPINIASSADMSKYLSMLVKIDCEPASASVGQTWASASAYKSLDFVDGNDATFVVFTNKTAAFVDATVPAASGTITGIVGVNSGNYQLMPRVIGDIQLTNAAEIPTLSVDPTSLSFDAAGGTQTITITATVPAGHTLKIDKGTDTFYTATLNGTTITVVTTANAGDRLNGSLKVYMTDGSNNEVTAVTKNVAISQAAPGVPTVATYSLVTSTAAVVPGEYIMVGIKDSAPYTIWRSNPLNGNNLISTTISSFKSGDSFEDDANGTLESRSIIIASSGDNFTIQFGGKYFTGQSTKSNYLKLSDTAADNYSKWTIEVASSGVTTIKMLGTGERNWIRFNPAGTSFAEDKIGSGSEWDDVVVDQVYPIFSCYASGQSDVYLYKRD